MYTSDRLRVVPLCCGCLSNHGPQSRSHCAPACLGHHSPSRISQPTALASEDLVLLEQMSLLPATLGWWILMEGAYLAIGSVMGLKSREKRSHTRVKDWLDFLQCPTALRKGNPMLLHSVSEPWVTRELLQLVPVWLILVARLRVFPELLQNVAEMRREYSLSFENCF